MSIVVLATDCESTRIVANALQRAFGCVTLVLEQPVSRALLLRRRMQRLGVVSALGQAMFVATVPPVLRRRSRARIEQICRSAQLDAAPFDGRTHRIASVNSDEARALHRELDPAVVVVNGTRIISRATLECITAPFINTHYGITPRYRGVHGGYWALAEGQTGLVGSTVHLVDAGIDSGPVLAQALFLPTSEDNFATYPYLHLAAALPALRDAVRGALSGALQPAVDVVASGASQLWHHPTLWNYAWKRVSAGVK